MMNGDDDKNDVDDWDSDDPGDFEEAVATANNGPLDSEGEPLSNYEETTATLAELAEVIDVLTQRYNGFFGRNLPPLDLSDVDTLHARVTDIVNNFK